MSEMSTTTSKNTLVHFIIVISAVIIGDIWCGDATSQQQNPWQLNAKRNDQVDVLQLGINSKSTTPWPALGARKNQQNSIRNVTQQPLWIRPNNGPNWVRNTPSPQQNPNNHPSPQPNPNNHPSPQQNPNNHPSPQQISNNPATQQKINVLSPQQNLNIRNIGNNKPQNQNTLFLNNERGNLGGGSNVGQNVGGPHSNSQDKTNTNVNMQTSKINGRPSGVIGIDSQNTALSDNRNGAVNLHMGQQNNNRLSGISLGSMTANREPADTLKRNNNDGQQNGEVTDDELRELAEELLSRDSNNAARHVTINLQGMTTSRSTVDQAPLPLISIAEAAFNIPSISKMVKLHNNYILETNQNEVYTAQEKLEENDFLDTILETSVMQYARNFLLRKGKIGRDPKDFKDLLRSIWFNMYSRGGGRIGSSGFEHVFLAELKNKEVSGLHNWIYFSAEESKNNANYLGYMKKIDLGNKGAILKYHFNFHNANKPVGSLFIGTSPELEMALYSTCFILRADRICPLKMNGNRFIIRTYTYRYRGKNMIGSAFPDI